MAIKQNTPEIYVGIICDPSNLTRCLMEDVNFVFSVFNNRAQLETLESYESLIKPTINRVWSNFSQFTDEIRGQTLLAYHENLFGAEPPKKQQEIQTQLWCWHKMTSQAKNNLTSRVTTDPVSGRKSTIGDRRYFVGDGSIQNHGIKTFQAIKSLELFHQCMVEQGIKDGDKMYVTEAVLKQYVIDHAAVLKTKQDPWRIFQYYRPQLIQAKLIRTT